MNARFGRRSCAGGRVAAFVPFLRRLLFCLLIHNTPMYFRLINHRVCLARRFDRRVVSVGGRWTDRPTRAFYLPLGRQRRFTNRRFTCPGSQTSVHFYIDGCFFNVMRMCNRL